MNPQIPDIKGQRFGRLIALEMIPGGRTRWKCHCDCGAEITTMAQTLMAGDVRSCGCLKRELDVAKCKAKAVHGLAGTSIYGRWHGMLRRCYSVTNPKFKRYGARGIKVCECLRASVMNLVVLLGAIPSASHTVGRIHNDRHYSCGSCVECIQNEWAMNVRWETPKQQARNKSTSRFLTAGEETMTLQEWSERTGIKYHTIFSRIQRGRDPLALIPK